VSKPAYNPDAGGEYSQGRGPKPRRTPGGREIPPTSQQLAQDARSAMIRERAGDSEGDA
jgi:hypothetical protein